MAAGDFLNYLADQCNNHHIIKSYYQHIILFFRFNYFIPESIVRCEFTLFNSLHRNMYMTDKFPHAFFNSGIMQFSSSFKITSWTASIGLLDFFLVHPLKTISRIGAGNLLLGENIHMVCLLDSIS